MPPVAALSIAVDVAEPRVKQSRLALLHNGLDWDLLNGSYNVLREYITHTTFLRPYAATAEWYTTAAGNYHRNTKAEHILITAAQWDEHHRGFNGNIYLHSQGVNEKVYVAPILKKNQGMYLSWVAYNVGDDNFVQLECGWGEGTAADIRLRFWSDGNVEVYKNGSYLGDGKLNSTIAYPMPKDRSIVPGIGKPLFEPSSKQTASETIDVILLPGRHRELFVLTNQGGGFNWKFEDIAPEEQDPVITGPGKFWWFVPQGQATVSDALLKFFTTGYVMGPKFTHRFAPAAGAAHTERAYYDKPGYGTSSVDASLKKWDGVTDFVPDGADRHVRARVDLTGDGTNTPFVYGVSSYFESVTANTDGAHLTVIDNFTTKIELAIPESYTDVGLSVTCRQPAALEAAGVTKAKTLSNRAINAGIGTVAAGYINIFVGRTPHPKVHEAFSDDMSEIVWACRDYYKVLEQYLFNDPIPFDGMRLRDAIISILSAAGFQFSGYYDIEDVDFILPTVGQASEGEYALLPEVGDTGGSWIDKLFKTYASTFYTGWVPMATGPAFRFRSPASMGSAPALTLYGRDVDAIAAGFPTGAYPVWYTDAADDDPFEPEANDLYVVGRDPRSRLPIIAHYADLASIDPTTIPSARPDNWLGEVRQYSWVDPSIATQEAANWALGIFIDRLTKTRTMTEWKSQFLLKLDGSPVWRGEVVRLQGKGDYRMNTGQGLFEIEDGAGAHIWREFNYTGQKVA